MSDFNIVKTSDTLARLHTAQYAGRQEPFRCPRKRAIDLFVALISLITLSPLFFIIMVAIRIDGPGPIFFRQRRTGLKGEVFRIYKFRTMHVVEDGATIVHATRDDQRVTRVGAILRRTSLDELPQFLNIFRGEMSLVGPRPHALSHDDHYTQHLPDYPLRFGTRPGLTGLAQIRGLRGEIHGITCMRDRLAADAEYLERWSLFLDLTIVFRTVPRLLYDRAAY